MRDNPIKQVVKQAKSSQKEICQLSQIPQSTMSKRMKSDVKGSLEWSIEVAKMLGVRSGKVYGDGYELSFKIINNK
jgi:hypothetical protein